MTNIINDIITKSVMLGRSLEQTQYKPIDSSVDSMHNIMWTEGMQ